MQTNRNSTRRSLLVSATALILSIAMLVGTTFAWFTDSASTGVNKIQAGNLDIDVMYANTPDGTYTSIENKNVADLFVAPNGAKKGLWEPGHTEVAYLKVVNKGTLALKYQFKVDAASEVIGKSVLGNDIKLSEILKFAATDPADAAPEEYNRESAQAAAEASGSNLLGYTTSTNILAPGASQYITLVVYMPETTGNEANYRDNAVPTINFKLTALATQVKAESDSFGDDYDEDAWDNALLVTTAEDLKAAIAAGNEEIMLANDIALTEALEIPAGTTLALNLNGKTLSGSGLDAEGKSTAIIVNNGTFTVSNGKIQATGENGGATINNKGTLTLADGANIVGAPIAKDSGYPSYCITSSGNLTIENGTTVSADRGCLYLSGTGSTVINGGSFTNNDISDKRDQFTSHVVVVANGANNKLTINGGTFKHLHTKTSGGVVINNWSAVTVDVNGGNFSGGNYFGKWDNLSDYGYGSTNTPFAVRGGTFTGMDDKFVAAGYKAVESSGAWTVVPENAIATSNDLIAAINAADDGDTLLLAPGEYSLRFTNNTAFNVDDLNIKGMDNAKLTVSSSEVWYGRVQGDNVTFENIHFTSSVGATGKATYKNCTFDDGAICASSGNKETYFNNCDINGTLNTSTDLSSGNTYVTDSTVAKAEFSGAATMYFTNCQIGELISWDMATVLENCVVEKQDLKMEDQKVTTIETDENGLSWATNTANPDALVLYLVPSDYAETTLAVPEGATAIGNYAFAYNTNVERVVLPSSVTDLGRGFDSSSVEKVVLNEGLEVISSRAFRSTTALKEVVISSSVKEIADNAFQKSSIKEIVIPANVKTIGEAAFASSKIEKVTFEGNTSIQGFAFRSCPNLREVHLEGNDVTFIASTLNGRNSMWFCNGESNNPNTSNITFYVANETVAARVKAAMGAEAGNTPVYVDGVLYTG